MPVLCLGRICICSFYRVPIEHLNYFVSSHDGCFLIFIGFSILILRRYCSFSKLAKEIMKRNEQQKDRQNLIDSILSTILSSFKADSNKQIWMRLLTIRATD